MKTVLIVALLGALLVPILGMSAMQISIGTGPWSGGYFPVGEAPALAALARRFCADEAFASHLREQCAAREPLFRPALERRAVRAVVADALRAPEPRR